MKRFLRILLNTAMLMSLLLCVAASALWVRSYYAIDSYINNLTPTLQRGAMSEHGYLTFTETRLRRSRLGGTQTFGSETSFQRDRTGHWLSRLPGRASFPKSISSAFSPSNGKPALNPSRCSVSICPILRTPPRRHALGARGESIRSSSNPYRGATTRLDPLARAPEECLRHVRRRTQTDPLAAPQKRCCGGRRPGDCWPFAQTLCYL
jgi:hypothetical protein